MCFHVTCLNSSPDLPLEIYVRETISIIEAFRTINRADILIRNCTGNPINKLFLTYPRNFYERREDKISLVGEIQDLTHTLAERTHRYNSDQYGHITTGKDTHIHVAERMLNYMVPEDKHESISEELLHLRKISISPFDGHDSLWFFERNGMSVMEISFPKDEPINPGAYAIFRFELRPARVAVFSAERSLQNLAQRSYVGIIGRQLLSIRKGKKEKDGTSKLRGIFGDKAMERLTHATLDAMYHYEMWDPCSVKDMFLNLVDGVDAETNGCTEFERALLKARMHRRVKCPHTEIVDWKVQLIPTYFEGSSFECAEENVRGAVDQGKFEKVFPPIEVITEESQIPTSEKKWIYGFGRKYADLDLVQDDDPFLHVRWFGRIPTWNLPGWAKVVTLILTIIGLVILGLAWIWSKISSFFGASKIDPPS